MPSTDSSCSVCQSRNGVRMRRFRSVHTVLCDRCHKLAGRKFNTRRGRNRDRIVEAPSREDWIATLRTAWDHRGRCFRCMVSGVELLVDKPESARYPTLEHAAPGTGQHGWLVVAAVINDMKSDFAMDEFRAAVPLLARVLTKVGNLAATNELQKLLDELKHFRRVKATSKDAPIPVDEAE